MRINKIKKLIIAKMPKKKLYRSKPEQDIHTHIDEVYDVKSIEINNRKLLNGKEIDIYLPNELFGIEYNGLHWHSYPFLDEKVARVKHKFKTDMCDDLNINLYHIWEDDWLYNRECVLNIIDIHINPERCKLTPKQISIKKVKNKKDSYKTFEKYGIQRLNKNIKHDIYKVRHKDIILAYVQIADHDIINIAIHNSLISLKSVIDVAKRVRAKNIYLDKSTGIHNIVNGSIIKKCPPKSRKIKSKKRTSYSTQGKRIWDSGHIMMRLS